MIYAMILAGGNGTRMGSKLPKQYLLLNNKPIFIYSLEQFLLNKSIDKIIICCPNDWINYTKDIIKQYNILNIDIIEGGKSRPETLMNGCNFISEKYGIKNDDIIITHDAVRPFINQRMINDNIKYTKKYGVVSTVIKASDTIFESNDNKIISNIPIRDKLYHAQTPQSFNLKKLISVYQSLTDDELNSLTDGCKAFILRNKPVYLVDGEPSNIKITTPFDLILAENILSKQ